MFRRMFWFVVGVVVGVSGFAWMKRTMSELADKLTPGNVARLAGEQSAKVFGRVGRAFNAAVTELLDETEPDSNRPQR